MKRLSAGFTLTEILIVVIIIGILTAIGVPRYEKTVETSKADEAVALLQLVYSANKMYMINNCPSSQNCYCTGDISGTDSCDTGVSLVSLNYLQNFNDPERSYEFYGANNVAGTARVACAKRRTGSSPGTDATGYKDWRYKITTGGVLCGHSGTSGSPPPLPAGSSECSTMFACN